MFIGHNASLLAQNRVWREDFNDNKRKWYVANNEHYNITIQNGYYEIDYKQKEIPERNPFILRNHLSLIKDWDIEIRVKVIKLDGDQNGFGLAVGEQDRGNSHYYVISPSLKRSWWFECRLFKQTELKMEPLPLNIFSSDDPETGTQILLKHRTGQLYFYVNDILMTRVATPKTWHGNGIGLYANTSSILRVDYLEIREY